MGKKMTFEDHEHLGRRLFGARQDLMRVIVDLPKTSKEAKALIRALKAIEHARCVMDSKVFRDFGDKGFNELVSVYYGVKTTATILRLVGK